MSEYEHVHEPCTSMHAKANEARDKQERWYRSGNGPVPVMLDALEIHMPREPDINMVSDIVQYTGLNQQLSASASAYGLDMYRLRYQRSTYRFQFAGYIFAPNAFNIIPLTTTYHWLNSKAFLFSSIRLVHHTRHPSPTQPYTSRCRPLPRLALLT